MTQPPPTTNGIPLRAHYASLAMQALIPVRNGFKFGEICQQAVDFADVLIHKLSDGSPDRRIEELEAALQGALAAIDGLAESGWAKSISKADDVNGYTSWKATLEKGKQ
jgi:hypothetical protein